MFLFNLIVGTGALTMPKAFASAGWILSLVVVVLLCFMSFVTTTFVVECMSVANYYVKMKRLSAPQSLECDIDVDAHVDVDGEHSHSETSSLLPDQSSSVTSNGGGVRGLYDVTHRVELGTMARAFLPRAAVRFFYTAIAVYLYGDLVIYSAAISKSLRDITWSVTL